MQSFTWNKQREQLSSFFRNSQWKEEEQFNNLLNYAARQTSTHDV